MIHTSTFFSSPFDVDLEDFHFSSARRIREEQRVCSEKAVNELKEKHIHKGEVLCTLSQVHEILLSKGVSADRCTYVKNNISERLDVYLKETNFNLTIPLFPKQDPRNGIALIVGKSELHERIDSFVTPEGLADFILGISDWLPEYYGIELRIQEEEMQKQKVREIALDLLKRNIGAILEEKGYKYVVYPPFSNKASLIITFSDIIKMTLEVDLMEDFLDQVKRIVESLPANEVNV